MALLSPTKKRIKLADVHNEHAVGRTTMNMWIGQKRLEKVAKDPRPNMLAVRTKDNDFALNYCASNKPEWIIHINARSFPKQCGHTEGFLR